MVNPQYIGVERRERTHGVRFDNTINLGHMRDFPWPMDRPILQATHPAPAGSFTPSDAET